MSGLRPLTVKGVSGCPPSSQTARAAGTLSYIVGVGQKWGEREFHHEKGIILAIGNFKLFDLKFTLYLIAEGGGGEIKKEKRRKGGGAGRFRQTWAYQGLGSDRGSWVLPHLYPI